MLMWISILIPKKYTEPVADPGFPVGGADPIKGGGAKLRHGRFSAEMYAGAPNSDMAAFRQKCMRK